MELSFDTDQGRQMARKMLDTYNRINQAVQKAQQVCNALVGVGWIAPAANQFRQVLEAWINSMKPILQVLEENKRKLDREIAEWEETGRAFN